MSQSHCSFGDDLRRQTERPRGYVGDMCQPYEHTVIGEDNAIYAIHAGTLHDPRLERSCSARIGLLCANDAQDCRAAGTGFKHNLRSPGPANFNSTCNHALSSVYGSPWPASYAYDDKVSDSLLYGTQKSCVSCQPNQSGCA